DGAPGVVSGDACRQEPPRDDCEIEGHRHAVRRAVSGLGHGVGRISESPAMTVLEKPRYSPRQGEEAKKALLYRRQNDFWWFRRHVRPEMLQAWWQQDVAKHLNTWFQDFKLGKRPKLVLQSPPQHGKSEQVRDFVAWLLGNNRGLKIIFTTYSDELGMATNLALQRMFA